MNKKIIAGFVVAVALLLAGRVVASSSPSGDPFVAVWDAINSLIQRLDDNDVRLATLENKIANLESDCTPGYTDNGDGTITDSCANLVWQKESGDSLTWADSNTYCSNLVLANQSDWRLPNISELNSIIEYDKAPALDPSFVYKTYEATPDRSFNWSSTTYLQNDSRAWVVEFYTGDTGTLYKGESLFPRCVRN